MRLFRSRILAFLLLTSFLLAKASFWIALSPAGTPLATEDDSVSTPHPCACSGAPVCQCGPGGCCDTGSDSNPNPSDPKSQTLFQKLCGKLSQGSGPIGEAPALPILPEACVLLPLFSQPLCHRVPGLLTLTKDQPIGPPPKA